MNRYQAGYRRMLVDMHIPDWDPGLLAQYDPKRMADLYERANLTSVMLYCNSHVGLCNWPTKVGKMHEGLAGRDIVGELVSELDARDIATCAYFSVVFDNWAVEANPDWRQRTAMGFDAQDFVRYGFNCMNHPDYRAYVRDLLTELLTTYRFDAIFFDMVFWPLQCECEHCIARFRAEDGYDAAPQVIDWTTPEWPAWQAARERWADGFCEELATLSKQLSPGIATTHNLAPGLGDYSIAQPLAGSRHDTFIAGDLYGDRYEQLLVTKLSLHLTETRPAEFMTSRCVNLLDHVRIKREEEMAVAAAAATALGSGFLFIDAIDPAGTANEHVFDRIGRIFRRTEPFEPMLGGEPIEDIAIWFSVDSQMDFADNGTSIRDARRSSEMYPHGVAAQGASRALQRAHLPYGVITRKQLGELDRWKVIVLPNVLRMDDDEIAAFRAFAAGGGKVYASRWTSLVDTAGARRTDFGMADLFGASIDGEEMGRMIYYRPVDDDVVKALLPQSHLSVTVKAKPLLGVPRLRAGDGQALAKLTVPYGYPNPGTVKDHHFASIHSSPPWEDLEHPVLVRNGNVIYSASDIESVDAEANESLFVHLIRSLLGEPSWSAEAHPSVWVNVFDQPDQKRYVASFLNATADLPAVPVPATLDMGAATVIVPAVDLLEVIAIPYGEVGHRT